MRRRAEMQPGESPATSSACIRCMSACPRCTCLRTVRTLCAKHMHILHMHMRCTRSQCAGCCVHCRYVRAHAVCLHVRTLHSQEPARSVPAHCQHVRTSCCMFVAACACTQSAFACAQGAVCLNVRAHALSAYVHSTCRSLHCALSISTSCMCMLLVHLQCTGHCVH